MAPRTLATLALVAAGCSYGQTAPKFIAAYGPHGVTARIVTVRGEDISGELLAVEDAALLIERQNALTRVAYASIREARFEPSGRALGHGRPPSPTELSALKLRSRYPQGVSEDLLRTLLAAHGQQAVKEVGP
jgi:hypothetical protein